MKLRSLPLALVLASLAGCAALTSVRDLGLVVRAEPEEQLELGLAALAVQDFTAARVYLEPVYQNHWDRPVGQRALLSLVAAELDSRNPERRLGLAANLAGWYLNSPFPRDWQVPVAEAFYTLALELGASQQRLAEAQAALAQAQRRPLPEPTRESVPDRLTRVTAERDELRQQVATLTTSLATREKELADTRQELDRVMRTIRD